ncbi:MAG: hypothetical protein ACOH1I_05510 [Gallionellaceae bacterium]|jgi:hypothetical protein
MQPHDHESSRLELYKAGKIEERRSARAPHAPLQEALEVKENSESIKLLRPELIAIGLLLLLLVVLVLAGM